MLHMLTDTHLANAVALGPRLCHITTQQWQGTVMALHPLKRKLSPRHKGVYNVRMSSPLGELDPVLGTLLSSQPVQRSTDEEDYTVSRGSLLKQSVVAALCTATLELGGKSSAMESQASSPSSKPVSTKRIFEKATKRALGGGASGAAAAVVQVLSLMWLRTTMNYQYRYGTSTKEALQNLYKEGGISRFYLGLPFALVQGPLSRFGDTAANIGVLVLLDALESTKGLPLPVKSAAGSLAAALWRILLTPVDTFKTTMQVSGPDGIPLLMEKVKENGPSSLFEGAIASAAATFVGHYPWYFTYNALNAALPTATDGDLFLQLARQAFLGLCASSVSDCCSNSIRVVKTTKQTAPMQVSYTEAIKMVVDEDGVVGLFVRGLQTRILVNALQGALFSVLWKYFEGVFGVS
ncbi:unnamed protein product [Choristocarpus tenellus]